MNTAKRSRRRQAEARAASPLPAAKRLKTTKTSHVPGHGGLGFLVDEDTRNGKTLQAKLTNGVPNSRSTRVDESHAVVAPDTMDIVDNVGSDAQNAIGISSAEENSSSEESSDEDGEGNIPAHVLERDRLAVKAMMNGHLSKAKGDADAEEDAVAGAEDVAIAEPAAEIKEGNEADEEEPEELEEPSFGDMLQARHPDPIDVQASLTNSMANRQGVIQTADNRTLKVPSGTSLVTVLTQALRTNDKDMLETCFHTTDQRTIISTIQRLQSQHVAVLLQRLAERIYKRPGRTGILLTWVQWSLVAHGGYLASQPEVMKIIKPLSQIIRERASGLQPMLHMKGKLDMLSAQIELRRNMQAGSRAANAEDEDDEEGVVYVEGQDDEWSASEDDVVLGAQEDNKMIEAPIPKTKLQTATPRTEPSASADNSDDDMPNGVVQEANDSSDAEEEEENEGVLDVETDETSDDDAEDGSDEEADSEANSESEMESSSDESDASGVKQPDPRTLNRKR